MMESHFARLEQAKNPNAHEEDLWRLSTDDFYIIRIRVAENPATPMDLLQQLASKDVIAGVSACRRIPTPILLGMQYQPHIRWELSGRLDTPGSVLISFPDCSHRVIRHPNLPYGVWMDTNSKIHIRVYP